MKCFASVVNVGQTEPPFKHHWIQENDCSSSSLPGTLTARSCLKQHLFLVIPSCTLVFSCLGHYHVVKGDLCFPFRRWLHLCYCRKDLYFLLISEECFVMRWQTIHLLSHICVCIHSAFWCFPSDAAWPCCECDAFCSVREWTDGQRCQQGTTVFSPLDSRLSFLRWVTTD